MTKTQKCVVPMCRDDKPEPLARNRCIMNNSGALCRMQVSCSVKRPLQRRPMSAGNRQTDKQTEISIA